MNNGAQGGVHGVEGASACGGIQLELWSHNAEVRGRAIDNRDTELDQFGAGFGRKLVDTVWCHQCYAFRIGPKEACFTCAMIACSDDGDLPIAYLETIANRTISNEAGLQRLVVDIAAHGGSEIAYAGGEKDASCSHNAIADSCVEAAGRHVQRFNEALLDDGTVLDCLTPKAIQQFPA